MVKPTLFCLMGPTAVGKTDLACDLVQKLPLEIISVDSAMIYRDMNIGTAKPDERVLTAAPHHLIDILDPFESYSAARFCEDVATHSADILARGKHPLLVGGTMMYFRALQQGLSLLPSANESVRAQLLQQAETHGWAYLHQQLAQVDAPSAARIHPNDTQRIQRALEVYHLTSTSLSSGFSEAIDAPLYSFVNLILMPSDRAGLHHRIGVRFRNMLLEGLVDEVKALLATWSLTPECPSMRSVGYRQVIAYLQGEYDEDLLCEKGAAATRQLAKRQMTWLRHWPDALTFDAENPATKMEIMVKIMQILDNPISGN